MIPFDKTHREFQLLLGRIKLLLQNQTGNVKLYQLIEAATRLSVDTFNSLIRAKVAEGNYSRSPSDICSILYFFSTQFKLHKSQKDILSFENVLRNLRHMEVHQLQIEQMDLLVRGLAFSADPEFMERIQDLQGYFKEVEDFLPKLV